MRIKAIATVVLAAAAYGVSAHSALGQTPQPVILLIDTQNVVEYLDDVGDPARFGQIPGVTPTARRRRRRVTEESAAVGGSAEPESY